METITQRRTTAAQAGASKPTGARNSVFDNGPMTGSTATDDAARSAGRGGKRQRLPALDLGKLQFRASVAPPIPGAGTPGESKWHAVFDALKADGNAYEGIPAEYRASLSKVAHVWHQRSPELAQSRFVVRTSQDGTTFGLYRVAAKDMRPRGKKAAA